MTSVTTTTNRPGRITPGPVGKEYKGNGATVGERVFSTFSHAFLAIWALMVLLPLLWAVLSAFKDDKQIITHPLSIIPNSLHWDNFGRAWTKGHIGVFFLNNLLVVGGGVFLTMLLGSMAAYVLARYDFPGNRALYYMFLSGLSLPIYMAAVPLFVGTAHLGVSFPPLGLNSYPMLILVYVAWSLSFTVFFMHSFFQTLPTSVAEAALVDGASHSRLFFSVMLPMARPGLISIGIFNVLGQWNQWYLPVLLMNPPGGVGKHEVLSQGLIDLSVNQGYKSDWSGMFAGLVMAMLPVLAVYLVFQRQVQSGLTGNISK